MIVYCGRRTGQENWLNWWWISVRSRVLVYARLNPGNEADNSARVAQCRVKLAAPSRCSSNLHSPSSCIYMIAFALVPASPSKVRVDTLPRLHLSRPLTPKPESVWASQKIPSRVKTLTNHFSNTIATVMSYEPMSTQRRGRNILQGGTGFGSCCTEYILRVFEVLYHALFFAPFF